jgi:undecaprenyl-diphosphooligosaccharide--protein glycosyltransferase
MKFNIPAYLKGFSRTAISVTAISLAVVFLVSAGLRYIQLERWREHRESYFVDRMPQMTTLDAYKWLRYADEYKAGEYYPAEKDPLMFYPDNKAKHEQVPMLSWLIAKFSVFSDGNTYRTAVYLMPTLASLFIIPLVLYFFHLGMLPAGLAGGVAGSLGIIYLVRTSIGRVDTDAMNLFFPFLCSLFILLVIKNKEKPYRPLVYSAMAGLSMLLFHWWYEHPGITLAYVGVFVLCLALSRVQLKTAIISFVLFIIFANPLYVQEGLGHMLNFVKVYVTPTGTISAGFPDIYETITEARQADIGRVLESLTPFSILTILGLVLFVFCGIFNFRRILPLAPVFVLGLLVFKSSNRFGMFLAPFVGIGIGYGIYLIWSLFLNRFNIHHVIRDSVLATVAVGVSILIYSSSFSFNPTPSISVGIYKQINELKKNAPEGTVLYSWWDYGLAYEYKGFATFHDGMTQRTPKTFFIAKSLVSDNQTELYNTLAFLASEGNKGINTMISEGKKPSEIVAMSESNDIPVEDDKYTVVFTGDMLYKLGSISYIGTWGFEDKSSGSTYRLQALNCTHKEAETLICGRDSVNLNTGVLNNNIMLKSHRVVVNGRLFNSREFHSGEGYHLVESRSEQGFTDFIIMDDKSFQSNLIQMFVIGNIDTTKYQEIYNAVPFMRAFKVIGR